MTEITFSSTESPLQMKWTSSISAAQRLCNVQLPDGGAPGGCRRSDPAANQHRAGSDKRLRLPAAVTWTKCGQNKFCRELKTRLAGETVTRLLQKNTILELRANSSVVLSLLFVHFQTVELLRSILHWIQREKNCQKTSNKDLFWGAERSGGLVHKWV